MIKVIKIKSFDDFPGHGREWNALLKRSGADCIFLTWEWLTNWWKVFGVGRELYVLLGYFEENLIGIAPLMKSVSKMYLTKARYIEFIGSGFESMPDHLNSIVANGFEEEFARQVFKFIKNDSPAWDVVRLRDMYDEKRIQNEAMNFFSQPYRAEVVVSSDNICPYIILPKTWDEYSSTLSSSHKYAINRKTNKLLKSHAVEFAVLKTKAKLSATMARLEEIHKARMLSKKCYGNSLREEFWEFHRRIADALFDNGWLLIGTLSAGGKIIACLYSFVYAGKTYYYQSGIDPKYDDFGAGVVLMGYMVKESIHRGCTEFDFLRGSEKYKFHWTKSVRQSAEITVWNGSFKSKYILHLHKLDAKLKSLARAILPGLVSKV